MSIKLQLPKLTDLKPRIAVLGVGGAGGNAVNNMISAGLSGVEFVTANTDAQALLASSAENRIQLGVNLTEGLGAGSKPEIGEAAAEEAADEIRNRITGAHMLFIAAGMGGGTGTGAAAVIARLARDLGILTVAVVTKPFLFEGSRRMRIAETGVIELKKHVDTLIVIPNQNLFRIASEKTTFAEAFVLADQVLYSGIACIVDLIVKEGIINLDLADVKTVLAGMGTAMMGTGEASGERRAIMAAEAAIANPLVDDVTLQGAKGLLLSIIGGPSLTLYEIDEAASRVRREVDPDANIIVGATFDESLGDRIRVSIVASGMNRSGSEAMHAPVAASPLWPKAGGRPGAGGPPPLPSPPPAHDATSAMVMSPPHPSAPPHRAASGVEFHQRLNDAMVPGNGYPLAPEASLGLALGNPAARQDAVLHRAPGHAAQSGESWQGPGDVTIEDYNPGLSPGLSPSLNPGPSDSRYPRGQTPGASQTESVYQQRPIEFSPQPPPEPRRSMPRMPGVEDFPDIAQREYRAKAGHSASSMTDRPASLTAPYDGSNKSRKGGLLQRLTAGSLMRKANAGPAAGAEDRDSNDDGPSLPRMLDQGTRRQR